MEDINNSCPKGDNHDWIIAGKNEGSVSVAPWVCSKCGKESPITFSTEKPKMQE